MSNIDWYICTRQDDCGEANKECDHWRPHEWMGACDDDACPAVEGYVECVLLSEKEKAGDV